jgi:hypothetical protein
MRSSIAAFSLTCLLLGSAANAQEGSRAAGNANVNVPGLLGPAQAAGTAVQGRVYNAESTLPVPTPVEEIKPATLALPNDAIEPYLLTKAEGPFMVMAKTFRGPDAERYALALVLELRREYGLPAYILRTKDFPMRSMIRNVPPTAAAYQSKPQLTAPEKVRNYDEAAVLVGNEKSLDASEKLLHKVRKIKPKCLNEIPSMFHWRQGLATALRTTNPYVGTQDLFPGKKKDNLVVQMNGGPRSIFQCPGRYTLQVAEFSGRSVFNPSQGDARLHENNWLRSSPLVTAHDDAERLADKLMKDPAITQTGCQTYVYHDRTSSKVTIGSFDAPNDPAAVQLREKLLKMAVDLSLQKDKFGREHAGVMIAPAQALTDLQDPAQPIKTK